MRKAFFLISIVAVLLFGGAAFVIAQGGFVGEHTSTLSTDTTTVTTALGTATSTVSGATVLQVDEVFSTTVTTTIAAATTTTYIQNATSTTTVHCPQAPFC